MPAAPAVTSIATASPPGIFYIKWGPSVFPSSRQWQYDIVAGWGLSSDGLQFLPIFADTNGVMKVAQVITTDYKVVCAMQHNLINDGLP